MQFVMVVQEDVIFMLIIEKKNIKMIKFLDLNQELIKRLMDTSCVMREDYHTRMKQIIDLQQHLLIMQKQI